MRQAYESAIIHPDRESLRASRLFVLNHPHDTKVASDRIHAYSFDYRLLTTQHAVINAWTSNSMGNVRNVMKLNRVYLGLCALLAVAALSMTACDDSDNSPVDCNETPDDPSCEEEVDCNETPDALQCLTPKTNNTHNERRCPELVDHENLRITENFNNNRNVTRMSRKFNKSYGEDTLVHPGETQTIEGRFWSGKTNMPGNGNGPEDEAVTIFHQVDDAWEILAEAITDNSGLYKVDLPEDKNFPRGTHRILSVLNADGTCVEHGVFVFEEDFETILTDIDATLTTDDNEMIHQMLNDLEHVPPKLDGAEEITNRWNDKGFLMLYLSARPVDYLSWTRIWLREEGFPYGPAKGADNLVVGSTAASYKKAYVERILNDLNWKILYGYGNAFSDVDGYVDGGIPKEDVFMVNEAGCPAGSTDKECTCSTESDDSACEKFTDLEAVPYADQDGVAYRGTVEIQPNTDYADHIVEHVKDHRDSNTPK